jgi:hypothetical protein
MNIIVKGNQMSVTSNEAVAKIAVVFADIEKAQRQAIKAVRGLRDEYQAIIANGEAGSLAPMAAFAQLDAMVTGQYAQTLVLHLQQFRDAESAGIDSGPMRAFDPEPGMVTPMSLGR